MGSVFRPWTAFVQRWGAYFYTGSPPVLNYNTHLIAKKFFWMWNQNSPLCNFFLHALGVTRYRPYY